MNWKFVDAKILESSIQLFESLQGKILTQAIMQPNKTITIKGYKKQALRKVVPAQDVSD